MPTDDFYVEVAKNVDVTSMSLSMDEGFVFSRAVGRRQTVTELCSVSHFSTDKTRSLISELVKKGVLTMGGAGRTHRAKTESEYADITFSPAALAEEVDLDLDQKKRILFVSAKLEDWNYYALLGLKRSAKGADIKKGYFRASKEFHPDSFFRRELGSFQKRVDLIFRAMKGAYDVLNNETARAAYDQTLTADDYTPAERRELEQLADEAAVQARAAKAEDDRKDRLDSRLKEKRLRRNPMVGRIKRGREFLQLAETAIAAKKHDEARRHARMAMDFTKNDAVLAGRAMAIIKEADGLNAKAIARKGEAFATTRPEDETEPLAAELVRLAHDDGELLVVAAKMFSIIGNYPRAMKVAQTATNASPDHEPAWETLLDIAEKSNSWHAAARAAERLLEFRPKDGAIKDRLKVAKRQLK